MVVDNYDKKKMKIQYNKLYFYKYWWNPCSLEMGLETTIDFKKKI